MIRRALASDAPQLLSLMRGLARFEGYDDRFAVTVEALLERGFAVLARGNRSAAAADFAKVLKLVPAGSEPARRAEAGLRGEPPAEVPAASRPAKEAPQR